jgi:hypothetical protein
MTKVCPLIVIASKRPKVICFNYQSTFKTLITNAKTSCPTYDIHRSKFVVVEWHFAKVGKTYIV